MRCSRKREPPRPILKEAAASLARPLQMRRGKPPKRITCALRHGRYAYLCTVMTFALYKLLFQGSSYSLCCQRGKRVLVLPPPSHAKSGVDSNKPPRSPKVPPWPNAPVDLQRATQYVLLHPWGAPSEPEQIPTESIFNFVFLLIYVLHMF